MDNLTCIMCPMGCGLQVSKGKNGELVVTGNNCNRGENFAKEELTNPKRVVTTLVKTKQGVFPVKTTIAIPKKLVSKVVLEVEKLKLDNVRYHQVLIQNVLGTGADVIVTGKNK